MITPFRIGSIVRYVKHKNPLDTYYSKIDQEHLITDLSSTGGHWSYATTQTAWFHHECFEFVRMCTDEDMKAHFERLFNEQD